MREILFRGKRNKDGEWVQGWFIGKTRNEPYKLPRKKYTIVDENLIAHYIVPSTICQFTGLTDKNGNKVFEGDIAKVDEDIYVCFWNECNYEFGFTNSKRDFGIAYAQDIEIIGNIIDNKELLEQDNR